MKIIDFCLMATTLAMTFPSCLRMDFVEEADRFEFDCESLEFQSGSEITEQTLAAAAYPKTLDYIGTVNANRSWRFSVEPVSVGDDVSWLTLSEYDHINLSSASQSTEMKVSALRNKTTSPRSAKILVLLTDGSSKVIEVSQKASVYELREPVVYNSKGKLKDKDNIRAKEDTCFVKVVCNTAWKAQMVSRESTADYTLLTRKGEDDGIIQLIIDENVDEEEKTATLKITATGCADQVVRFTQNAAPAKN